MALLQVLKGTNPGERIPLEGTDKFVMGRNPDCRIVIPVTSVSREHAQILRLQGRFFIEDLQSRNGTFVNDKQVTARTPLKDKDTIRICDFQAKFLDARPPLPPELARGNDDESEDEAAPLPEITLSHSSNVSLETQPADKIKALLEISDNLRALELDSLLPKLADTLFQVFRQADRCFLILAETEAPGKFKMMPKVVKTRRPHDEANARFSRSIVKQCLETTQSFLSDDAAEDKRLPLSQSVVDFRIRSVMCAPLSNAEGKPFGVIQLDTQDHHKKFKEDDLKLLIGVANQASVALQLAKSHEEAVAAKLVQNDLLTARKVQKSFLPKKLPEVPGYEFYDYYEPAQQVGGDYYGFIPLPGGRLVVALGDVAGKGVQAALLMAKLASDTRFCFLTENDPAKAMAALNDLLAEQCGELDRFVTLAAALLDPQTQTVTIVNAGHPSPKLYRPADGSLSDTISRADTGMPLGMLEGSSYGAHTLQLKPGESLMVFSDGVPDARDVKEKEFKEAGVLAAVKSGGPFTAKTLGERVTKAVKQHASGRSPHDDITLVCLGRTQ